MGVAFDNPSSLLNSLDDNTFIVVDERNQGIAHGNAWYKIVNESYSDLINYLDLNPIYKDGAGYFMLGAVHYKSPYIPFLLSWPDNNEAIKYLQLAHDTGKATLNQKNYLAQAIHKDGQIVKAKKHEISKNGKKTLVKNVML